MNIKEASRLTGVGEHMLRHYEKMGIIIPARNPNNHYRDYSFSDLTNIVMVKQYSELGIALKTIREILHGGKFDKTLDELGLAVGKLQNDLEWSRARLFHAENLLALFQMIKEGRPSDLFNVPDAYFYPRESDNSREQFKYMYESAGAVMPAFRIAFEDVDLPVYPEHQGMLTTRKLPELGTEPVLLPAHTVWRTILTVDGDHLVTRAELTPVKELLEKEGHTLQGDVIIYQIMNAGLDKGKITITIECDIGRI